LVKSSIGKGVRAAEVEGRQGEEAQRHRSAEEIGRSGDGGN
jgi:hypothetical protein